MPAAIKNGIRIQHSRTIAPASKTKIWKSTPIIIRTTRIIAPKILENMFEISVLKNSEILNPLG